MKYYKLTDFACKDGCGLCAPSNDLIEKLEMASNVLGKELVITSACRCKEHNSNIGGTPTSSHLQNAYGLCNAVDIMVNSDHDRFEILKELLFAGFKRIGIGKTFIHADVDNEKNQERIWTYPSKRTSL